MRSVYFNTTVWIKTLGKRIWSLYNTIRTNRSSRVIFIPALLILPGLMFLYAVLGVFFTVPDMPNKEEAIPINRDDSVQKKHIHSDELNALSQNVFHLKIEEMFLQSQLQLAKNDSVTLSIDLVDSAATLHIRGVPVRKCKIHNFNVSRAYKPLLGQSLLIQWLSSPFTAQKYWGTLPKSPIKIKKAPKDTTEANKLNDDFTTVEKGDVYYTIAFDRSLVIKIEQAQSPSFFGILRKGHYEWTLKMHSLAGVLNSLVHFRFPKHPLWIRLVLSKEDAKAIFRAIPKNTALALRM